MSSANDSSDERTPVDGPAQPTAPEESSLAAGVSDPASKLEGGKLFLWFFLALLLFSIYLLYYLMRPFLDCILLACVFAAISQPIYNRCLRLTGNKRGLAAFIVLLGISLVIALLITFFVTGLIPQARTSINAVNQWLGGTHLGDALATHLEPLLHWVQQHFPEFNISLMDIRTNITVLSSRAGQYLLSSASSLVGNTLLFFAHLALTLLIMFFLLIDGPALMKRLAYLTPMRPDQTGVLLDSMRRISRAVLVGGFFVAVLQGLVGGFGLYLVGIPALFWGTVMVFAALVPVLGTSLVWGPAVIFMLIMGNWESALFLLFWCGILVTSIDSFLRPLIMRDTARLPVILLFLSILGGINVFGVLGLLYGPMIMGLGAVMLDLYAEEYRTARGTRGGKGV
jgi:predicted PurR-regulated permease PerM